MAVQIVSSPIALAELQRLAEPYDGDFVKAVIDVQREVMAIGGDLPPTKRPSCSRVEVRDGISGGSSFMAAVRHQNSSSSIR